VFVLPGDGARLSGSIDLSDAAPVPFRGIERTYECEPAPDMGDYDSICAVGESAGVFMTVADQDGDGDGELFVGAPTAASTSGEGRIYVLE
jgi:hypothetical protein